MKNTEYHIETLLNENENILWRNKPKFNTEVYSRLFCVLPFMLIWLAVEFFIIGWTAMNNIFGEFNTLYMWLIIGATVLHIIPVSLWFAEVMKSNSNVNEIEYALTETRLIIIESKYSFHCAVIDKEDFISQKYKRNFGEYLFDCGRIIIETENEKIVLKAVSGGFKQFSKFSVALKK